MLVLSRKKNESICIDGDIEVTVLEVRGDRVRLGIVAPREVRVMRKELLTAVDVKPGGRQTDLNDCETVLSIAEDPVQEDSLRCGTSRNHTSRNGGWRPPLPR